MPIIAATAKDFTEIANTFGFSVATYLVFGLILYKLIKSVIDHLMKRENEKSCAYEKLIKDVQEKNEIREAKYEITIAEITEKSEARDKEHIVIIKNLSENFNVLKDVLVKVEDIEDKMSRI